MSSTGTVAGGVKHYTFTIGGPGAIGGVLSIRGLGQLPLVRTIRSDYPNIPRAFSIRARVEEKIMVEVDDFLLAWSTGTSDGNRF